MIQITLPIKEYTKEQRSLIELDIEINEENYVAVDYIFYNIAAISRDFLNPEETIIHANGDSFVCPFRLDIVQEIIATELAKNKY